MIGKRLGRVNGKCVKELTHARRGGCGKSGKAKFSATGDQACGGRTTSLEFLRCYLDFPARRLQ
jgi:hypothetical protein